MEDFRFNVVFFNKHFAALSPQNVLLEFITKMGKRLALASSLGIEDQVLTDMMLKIDPTARIFTLDTGRLFPQTYQLIDKTNLHYNIKIETFFPDYKEVEAMVNQKGINLFYDSIENRKLCCKVRKINPLERAFETLDVWICGLRKSQSVTRKDLNMFEWDEAHNKLKINPLINWSEEEVWDYIHKNNVPYNSLHDQNYPSIGCQPCTRAVSEGEDIRSGRWWWEAPEHKECGLHKR
ncbi:MAG: phosphoadenylyl-sulfate reductase [Bacteroidales bacterium]|jgi:phosphoadenosine phosphosulfate reductase|nr:phosphoadenylyl-sulfate reductase [Bacteroidales bacterium]